MVDTVHIKVDIVKHLNSEYHYIEHIRNIINFQKEGFDKKSGVSYFQGHFKNFFVELKGTEISLYGSLTKYFKGSNLDFLETKEMRIALKMLAHELGIPIQRGRLSRIDIAENLFLTSTPLAYIDCLVGYPRKTPTEVHMFSKTFRKSCVTSIFYDKAEELKNKDPAAYLVLKNKDSQANVLRFEVRLMKQIPKALNMANIRVAHLYSSTFLKKLAQYWLSEYDKIIKLNNRTFNHIQTPAQFKKQIMMEGLASFGGMEAINKTVKIMQVENGWTLRDMSNIRVYFRGLANDPYLSTEKNLVKELDEAIANSKISIKYC